MDNPDKLSNSEDNHDDFVQNENKDFELDNILQTAKSTENESHSLEIKNTLNQSLNREFESVNTETKESQPIINQFNDEALHSLENSSSPNNQTLIANENLKDQYIQVLNEHKAIKDTNIQLQNKLFEYFRRKKADTAGRLNDVCIQESLDSDGILDHEHRYNKFILNIKELKQKYRDLQASYENEIEKLKNFHETQEETVNNIYDDFINYKIKLLKSTTHSQTGKSIDPKELTAILNIEATKEASIKESRLENIKLRNELIKIETLLNLKEQLADGLQLIDFEQLKIENQTYNEKIYERNDEILKLKVKISKTVQITANIKEKLMDVVSENSRYENLLQIRDGELRTNKNILTKLKRIRDNVRTENIKLKQSCGLLGNKALLLNYEDCLNTITTKKNYLKEIKTTNNKYKTETNQIKEAINNKSKN